MVCRQRAHLFTCDTFMTELFAQGIPLRDREAAAVAAPFGVTDSLSSTFLNGVFTSLCLAAFSETESAIAIASLGEMVRVFHRIVFKGFVLSGRPFNSLQFLFGILSIMSRLKALFALSMKEAVMVFSGIKRISRKRAFTYATFLPVQQCMFGKSVHSLSF